MEDDRLFPDARPARAKHAKSAATPKPRPHEPRTGLIAEWANRPMKPELAGLKGHGPGNARLPRPDAEAMALFTELQAALIVAVNRGDVSPAVEIADSIVARRLMSGPRGQVLAHGLVELSFEHRAAATGEPDPYAPYARHLQRCGLCTPSDLDIAFMGRVLRTGLQNGSLSAELHDSLSAAAGDDPAFRELLTQIERRTD